MSICDNIRTHVTYTCDNTSETHTAWLKALFLNVDGKMKKLTQSHPSSWTVTCIYLILTNFREY